MTLHTFASLNIPFIKQKKKTAPALFLFTKARENEGVIHIFTKSEEHECITQLHTIQQVVHDKKY